MIKVDGADDWKNTKYVYALPADLSALMAANDFRVPAGKNNICYFIGMADGTESGVGDDNEFVIATWGESTSTVETGTPGLLLDGTQGAIDALEAATFDSADFTCAADMTDVMAAFVAGVDGTESDHYIDDNGDIIADMTP